MSLLDQTPTLQELKAYYKKSESLSLFLLKVEFVMLLLLMLWLPWKTLLQTPLPACCIIGFAFYQMVEGYGRMIFLNKKDIRELRDNNPLGYYTKQDLLTMVRQVLDKMGHRNTPLKVYLLGDKAVNAFAIRVGFSTLFPSLNAIYLNRSTLHLLKPEELKSVIGHEFAHVLQYRVSWREYDKLHYLFVAIAGLWALVLLNATESYLFFVVLGLQFVLTRLFMPNNLTLSRVIEYLCDYTGYQVSNIEAAINTELKMGSENEAHQDLLFKITLASQGQNINPSDILELYDDALPYGAIDPNEIQVKIEELIKNKTHEKSGISLKGWLDYMQHGDDRAEDFQEQMVEEIRDTERMPLMPWRTNLNWSIYQDSRDLNVEKLVQVILSNPNAFLFKLKTEIPSFLTTHPKAIQRILFLYKNQVA